MVFSLARHFLRDPWRAEELAQEVFLQLYQRLSEIESPQHLVFWLRRITSHRCIDQARRGACQHRLSLDDVAEPQAAASNSDPLLARTLGRLVASLPSKARLVIILRYQENMEYHEIAETLGMPINTVKSSLQRALKVLRAKLARTNTGKAAGSRGGVCA
jgi:RNA polymerase sigma-70 factor (ECF subfamily)